MNTVQALWEQPDGLVGILPRDQGRFSTTIPRRRGLCRSSTRPGTVDGHSGINTASGLTNARRHSPVASGLTFTSRQSRTWLRSQAPDRLFEFTACEDARTRAPCRLARLCQSPGFFKVGCRPDPCRRPSVRYREAELLPFVKIRSNRDSLAPPRGSVRVASFKTAVAQCRPLTAG